MDISKLGSIHTSIASDVFPGGVKLTCKRCGSVLRATSPEAAGFLRSGCPLCCGATMVLSTPAPEGSDAER